MTRKLMLRGAIAAALLLVMSSVGAAQGIPAAPGGLTARALDGRVDLAWQPVAGADSYRVLRGTSPGAVTQAVAGGNVGGTSFTDAGAANGQTFYYAVQAIDGGQPSGASRVAGAAPAAAGCSTGNAIAVENCFPGSTSWKVDPGNPPGSNPGIEGFATKTSVDAGESVDLKVNTGDSSSYRMEIYRTGWYGGDQGRLVGTVEDLAGSDQPACVKASDNTGLKSCSNWSVSATLTTTPAWTSGVYLIKLVRPDGRANQILLVVRDDDGPQRLLYSVPDNTYQAYNNYGGKSVYPGNSSGEITVAGDDRAVKVSFDRPYQQTATRQRDFYTFTDLAAVSWLEQQGYSIAYNSSVDLERRRPDPSGSGLRAIWLGSHHEYWSAAMRSNLTAARNAGVSIASVGANTIYWKVRYESGERTMVVYKSTATGVVDPSGIPTGTWRDPQGANQPENALLGNMYIGDNDSTFFPLKVPYAQGQNRIWRYTSVASLQPGQTASIGTSIVGWEWDARVANGREPAGVQTVASSPVSGNLLQDAGAVYAPGNATVESTIYEAGSGALVFAAGTNYWARGLALNSRGQGNVRAEIQQATANLLADMRVQPTTPSGIQLDPSGDPAVQSKSPADGTADVPVDTTVGATFDRPMDAATITTGSFTLRKAGGTPLAASVTYDAVNTRAVLTPSQPLEQGATYTATVTTAVEDQSGTPLAANVSWSFTTRATSVSARTPAPNATGVATDTDVTATFDTAMDAATITSSSFTLTPAGGSPVAATVTYNGTTRTARLDPNAALATGTTYTARLTTAITSSDGAPLPAAVTWSFSTRAAFTVTAREPAPLASGVAPSTAVRATFVRDADPASLTASTFTLTGPSGAVAATIEYDAALRQATLRPSTSLALMTTYTAQLAASVRAADGQTLGAPVSWTFTTTDTVPSAPALVSASPAGGATGVARDATVSAKFDRPLDPATVTGTAVTIRPAGSSTALAATVSYDDPTRTVTLQPAAPLSAATTYSVRITTAVRGADGTPLPADIAWSFSTVDCPCRLMEGLTPVSTGNSTRDGRPLPGPWTYELGTRISVDRDMDLTAIRYWRDAAETGTHRARLWSSTGVVLAEANYTGESGSGWQRAALSQPVTLQAGSVYVVSTNYNAVFDLTQFGLQTPLVNGPLKTAGAPNGVYGSSAGTFPTQTSKSSNYFVDAEIVNSGSQAANPAVSSTTPASGATGVATGIDVTATFTKSLQASTVTTSSFTLRDAGGGAVAATVSYDGASRTAQLAPTGPLANGTTYTARLTTAIRSTDNLPLLQDYVWSFTVVGGAPQVQSTSPSDGATQISWSTDVRATFTSRLDPASVTTSTVTLSPSSGGPVAATVTYDDPTRTVRLVPSSGLAPNTVYTASITTGVRSNDGVPLAAPVSWSFTTTSCPCSLFPATLTPASTNLSVRDGRSGTGPWSRELGVKVEVTSPTQLTALRYYRASSESGTHTARVWTAAGSLIGSTTFQSDAGPGWKEQALATPISLTPGQVYVVSVGFNSYYSATQFGLQTPAVSGPLRSVAVATNGVYGDAAGLFPTSSYRSSNYFVDLVVE
jgi:hypothetical protein